MLGQGRPHVGQSSGAAAPGRIARRIWWTALATFTLMAPMAMADEPTLRVRIEWGGGSERPWQVALSASGGRLAAPRSLAIEADEPGSVWVDAGQVFVETPSPRLYDGVDVDVHAPLESKLVVELSSPGGTDPPAREEIPLAELVDGYHGGVLDPRGNRLLVRRAPGDRLRVTLSRDTLVASPGEQLEARVRPTLLGPNPPRKLRLQSRLVAASGAREVWTDDRELASLADEPRTFVEALLTMRLPDQEGVYDLILTAWRPGIQERLGLRSTLDERRVQLVVVSPERPMNLDRQPPMEVLVEIDPANPAWYQRLPALPLLPGMRRAPLGSGQMATWRHPLGTLVQLGPGGREPDIAWEAYPLPVARPGQPHIVEVEYPTDVPQNLGLSIIEPNAAGAVMPIGLDSGVYLPTEVADGNSLLGKHRLVFWPRTTAPLVLMTNRGHQSRASYGKIRLLGPRGATIPVLGRDPGGMARLPRAFPPGEPLSERVLAAYFDRPLFAENFSAHQGYDTWSSASGRALDDWTTFAEGGSRLCEYLHHVGYNAAVVSVLADGSTIYPSERLAPTPRYDDGQYFISGQDPLRKDVLELLLRLFDREQLQLIPAVQFTAPLPELEALRREDPAQAVGIDLVTADGTPWVVRHPPRQGLAPYYNPLDERVQAAMLGVVDELVSRYGAHPAFAGLALQLSAEGYAQFPAAECGCDERTLARFARETGIDLGPAVAASVAQKAALVLSRHRAAWLAWRAEKLASFHARLAAEVVAVDAESRLYLLTADVFNRPELRRHLRPTLPKSARFDDVLLEVGVDPARYAARPEIVLVRASRHAPLGSLAGQAVDLELNQAAELDRALTTAAHPASMFFHEPQEARLASFDARSPFKKTFTRLVAQPSPAGALNRRRFVHALATQDSQMLLDGGWLLPMGQEDELRDLIAAYRRLPALAFETLPGSTQPVTIRTATHQGRKYMYLVNDSPWKATVVLTLSAPGGCRLDTLSPGRNLPAVVGEGASQTLTFDLAPYELVGGVFSHPRAQLSNPRVRVQSQAPAILDARIKDLWARASALNTPPSYDALSNADFEEPASEDLVPGWEVGRQGQSAAELLGQDPHSGGVALRLKAGPQGLEFASRPFAAPATGRISVSAWLRIDDESRQPPLRLGVQGGATGREYLRVAPLGQAAGAQKLRKAWTQYVFQVQDLPADELPNLRVRFDLTGAGEAWIDDVQLYALDFSDQERLELSKTLTLVEYKCKNGEFGDCTRLLDGYWPRFLVANVPLEDTPVAARPALPPVKPPEADRKPGMIDRLRRSLPEFMR